MEVISINSAKGGTSKTTIAINLFDYLHSHKKVKVLVIDTDPQGSILNFLTEKNLVNFVTSAFNEKNLTQLLKNAVFQHFDYVLIDTQPTITKFNAFIMSVSHRNLITCKPSKLDFQSVFNTVEIAKKTEAKNFLLLTQTANNSSITKKNVQEIQKILQNEGIEVIKSTLSHSVTYVNSVNELKSIYQTKHTKQKIELTEIFTSLLYS